MIAGTPSGRARWGGLWCVAVLVLAAAACVGADPAGSADGASRADSGATDGLSEPEPGRSEVESVDPAVLLEEVAAASALSGVLSSEFGYACALRPGGAMECWGIEFEGDWAFTAVGVGEMGCGLRLDGTVQCWHHRGLDPAGERRWFAPIEQHVPAGRFAALSAGGLWACGLRPDGTAECWRYLSHTPILRKEPVAADVAHPGGLFTAVSAGFAHACGLRPDRTVACWGKNWFGQADAPEQGRFLAVDAGASHSCGLRTDGEIVCWGDDSLSAAMAGTIGYEYAGNREAYRYPEGLWGSTIFDANPVHTLIRQEIEQRSEPWSPPRGPFVAVSAGAGFTCGVRLDGTVACWGYYDNKIRVPLELFAEAAGEYVVAELVPAWGEDAGRVRVLEAYVGLADPPPGRFVTVAAGFMRACGVRPDGTIECWGSTTAHARPPPGPFATTPILAADEQAAAGGQRLAGRATARNHE